jgi:hypothetical protein
MPPVTSSHRKWPVLEIFGILLCGVGLCFAITFVGLGWSDEQLAKEKQQVATKLDEMKSTLTAAKIPAEQISGLLRVHKAALVAEATHTHFILLSFFILLSLLVSSVGLTVFLWGKLRALTRDERTKEDAQIAA